MLFILKEPLGFLPSPAHPLRFLHWEKHDHSFWFLSYPRARVSWLWGSSPPASPWPGGLTPRKHIPRDRVRDGCEDPVQLAQGGPPVIQPPRNPRKHKTAIATETGDRGRRWWEKKERGDSTSDQGWGGLAILGRPLCPTGTFETPGCPTSHLKVQPPLHFLPLPICTEGAGVAPPVLTCDGRHKATLTRGAPGALQSTTGLLSASGWLALYLNQDTSIGLDTGTSQKPRAKARPPMWAQLFTTHSPVQHQTNLLRPRFYLLSSQGKHHWAENASGEDMRGRPTAAQASQCGMWGELGLIPHPDREIWT